MNRAVLYLDLRVRRVSTLLWVLASAALVLMYMAIYPSISEAPALNDFLAQLPEGLRDAFALQDYTSPAGYLQSEVFSGLMPVVLLVLAIGRGSASIAGEEEVRRLDIVMSEPVRRRDIYLAKAAALGIVLALVTFVGVMLPILVIGPLFDLNVGVAKVVAASIQLFLFALLGGVIAEAAGAASGRKAIGIAVSSALFVVGFLVSTLGATVAWLGHLRPFTPWRWYNGNAPLFNGLGGWEVTVLLLASVAAAVVGLVLFSRRDLRV